MYKLDIQKFKSLPSCVNVYADGIGGFCAQGKLIAASGLADNSNYMSVGRACIDVLMNEDGNHPEKLIKVAEINNNGWFKEADALALEWAVESGKFELVNCVKEEELVNA